MPRLIVIEGSVRDSQIELKEPSLTIGRDADRSIVISEKIVSRLHARLVRKADGYHLVDEGSRYGTQVNEKPVTDVLLKNNDVIKIGMTQFLFEDETGAVEEKLSEIMHQIDPAAQEEIHAQKAEAKLSSGRLEDRLATLYHISRSLHSTLNLEDLLAEILEILYKLFRFGRGIILLVDPETGAVRPRMVKIGSFKAKAMEMMPFSRTIVDTVVRTKTAVLTQDAQGDERFSSAMSVAGYMIRSAMCAPLVNKDKITGVVYLDSQTGTGLFGKEDLELLAAVSNQASVAVENATLYKRIEEETMRRTNLSRFFSPHVVKHLVDKTEAVGLEGKRTHISVLFTDIRGFTALTQNNAPKVIVDILNRHHEILLNLIFKNGGTLDKFIGDSIMAFFGAPIAQEDAPMRALTSAIFCMNAIPQLNESLLKDGLPAIQIGIGIATGNAIVGTIGSSQRMEYTAIGDAVNLASRLVSAAGPREILMDKNTYLEAGKSTVTAMAEEMSVKGFEGKVQVYRISV